MHQIKYLLGLLMSLPLLPIMFFQARRIRATIPKLPEATGDRGRAEHKAHFKEKEDAPNNAAQLQLLTIGESTIAGVGVPTHERGFTGALATKLANELGVSVNWKVHAKSGYTAGRVTTELLPIINDSDIDLVVVGLGANDAFKFNSPLKWRREIDALIVGLKVKVGADTPIFFANMPPIREFPAFTSLIQLITGNLVELLGKVLADVVADHPNVYYNGIVLSLADWQMDGYSAADFFSDGVHPSELTYQLWGQEMAQFVCESRHLNGHFKTSL